MPELPEVETIRLGIEASLVGQTISSVSVLLAKSFIGDSAGIVGTSITGARRRGKLLIIEASGAYSILVHLKMTGQLILAREDESSSLPDKSTKVIFTFESGDRLFFNDYRTFGYVQVFDSSRLHEHAFLKKVGIEPFDSTFTFDYFSSLVCRHKGMNVKAFLLDQTKIAGLGNIYTDESLFYAHILPMRRVGSLTVGEQEALYQSVKEVLSKGVNLGGSSKTSYVNLLGVKGTFLSQAAVYGRGGLPCVLCGQIIEKTQFVGRGTHFCRHCQE